MGKKLNNKRRVANRTFIDSAILNDATFMDYLERLKRVATSMFEWVNLPDTMNERYIEETLYYFGTCAFLYDEDYEYINTKASSAGYLNIYGIPTKINCYSYGYNNTRENYTGLAKPSEKDGCVYVLNNYDGLPTIYSLELFAYRLYELQRAWDTNIINSKLPMIIVGTQEQKLTIENAISQIEGNKPVIVVDESMDLNAFKCIQTGIPFIADDLSKEKKEIMNEVLTFLGINNIDIEKKERLTAGETNSNNEVINLNLQSMLNPRKQACKLFNDLFNMPDDKKIDVRVRSDLYNIIKEVESSISDLKPNDSDGDINE